MMPGLSVVVMAGENDRSAAATVRAAKSFLSGFEVTDLVTRIHAGIGQAPAGHVALRSSFDDVVETATATGAEWALFLQPGDRLSGDAQSIAHLMVDPGVSTIEVTIDSPPLLPNPATWGSGRLMRLKTTGATMRSGASLRPGAYLDDPLVRTWALMQLESSHDDIDVACGLYHAGFHDAALVRLLRVAEASTDQRLVARASRFATMAAMAARRARSAKRPVETWLEASGRSASSLVWSAIVELGRDHPAAAWQAMGEASTVRAAEPTGIDPLLLDSLTKGLEGMLAARQSEALRYREVLRTGGEDRRRRAAQSLVHAWTGSGLDPAQLFDDLDDSALTIMEEALGGVQAMDVDVWLPTVEAFLERGRMNDRLAERIATTAAIRGIDDARRWSARLRSVGLGRFCPLLEIARDHADPAQRVLGAAIAAADFGDQAAPAAIREAIGHVPTARLPALMQKVSSLAPSAAPMVAQAAATTPRRAAVLQGL